MFIQKISITNFKLFKADQEFILDGLNVPDGISEWSWITLFLWENWTGKTTLLDALSLPLLSFKAQGFSLSDFNDPQKDVCIDIFSQDDFDFDGIMPRAIYKGKGFSFEARFRKKMNKGYLSSTVVSDQRYIRADWEELPKDGSPDLRIWVNNPFKGNRFNENDILFLDRNRTYQIRSGSYSSTRFDSLMEDFNYQYIKNNKGAIDINALINSVWGNIDNDFLNKAISKFKDISGYDLSLSYLDNWSPYSKAFFSVMKPNYQHIPVNYLWSGYEMIFSILYSYYLSQQREKQLILLIDEPELHLHPKLQSDFVKVLFEISKTTQIFLTTHSPLFVKQLLTNEKVWIFCLQRQDHGSIERTILEQRGLPYLSANEINYIAFWLPTEEYHNELYNHLEMLFWEDNDFKDIKNSGDYEKNDSRQIVFDNEFFHKELQEDLSSPFRNIQNKVTIHTYIRNKIHHSAENGWGPLLENLKSSIEFMRNHLLSKK